MKLDVLKPVMEKMAPLGAKVARHSPELFLAGGIITVLSGTVMACRATTKIKEHVEARDERIASADPDCDMAKEKTGAYLEMAGRVALDYAPAALLMAGGFTMIVCGHNQLRARLAAVSAAYITLDKAYTRYRNRVITDYGEDVDRRYRLGLYEEEIVEVKTLKNGKEKEVKSIVEAVHADGEEYSLYARYFDAFNSNMWMNNQEYNKDFLLIVQNNCNEKFQRQGYLFLNDVYDMLGFDKVPAGQIVGWFRGLGDDFVDFGIFEARNANARDFVNQPDAKANVFVLDFNVDGVIWNLIGNVPQEY